MKMAKEIKTIHIVGNDGDYTMFIHFDNSTKSLSLTVWNWRDWDDEPNGEEPYVLPNGVTVKLLSDLLPNDKAKELSDKIDNGDSINEVIEVCLSIRELY